MTKPKVLILCTGNSCRSHMAEGILRSVAGNQMDVFSAGAEPSGYVHPTAIEVMREIGIDVCGNADQACPTFPGKVDRYHWGFEDPPKVARPGETELDAFRRIRDEIHNVFSAYAAGFKQGLAS